MQTLPLITIITTAFNCADTLEATIQSVITQDYPNIEYIIVVSESTDTTQDIINKYKNKITNVVFQEAKGIYPALNCGLSAGRGEIIGILNSDDLYADKDVITTVAEEFKKSSSLAAWGDLVYVGRKNVNKIIRYWKSSQLDAEDFKRGWMPPHPTLFFKKDVFEKYGFYENGFKFSADYEMVLRLFYKHKIKGSYIPKLFIRMRKGGRGDSNFIVRGIEDYRVAKRYGLNAWSILLKKFLKISQFMVHPRS